jgi:hypothetical protein
MDDEDLIVYAGLLLLGLTLYKRYWAEVKVIIFGAGTATPIGTETDELAAGVGAYLIANRFFGSSPAVGGGGGASEGESGAQEVETDPLVADLAP